MLMVPMMIETIYKRLAAADPSIPKAVLAEKVFEMSIRDSILIVLCHT